MMVITILMTIVSFVLLKYSEVDNVSVLHIQCFVGDHYNDKSYMIYIMYALYMFISCMIYTCLYHV